VSNLIKTTYYENLQGKKNFFLSNVVFRTATKNCLADQDGMHLYDEMFMQQRRRDESCSMSWSAKQEVSGVFMRQNLYHSGQ